VLQVASISQLTVSRLSRQCGIINNSQPYRPSRPVTGIALLYGDGVFVIGSLYTQLTRTHFIVCIRIYHIVLDLGM
jgi:hypothetical protein